MTPGGGARGSVTAELAVALTGLTLVLGGLLAVAAAGLTQLRVTDAAGAAARAAARGEPASVVAATATGLAGAGSQATVTRAGHLVTVRVSAPLRLSLPGAPTLEVTGAAVAGVEAVDPP